jgi:hypothetical protein
MAADTPPNPYEAAVASLREKEARLVAELDAVRKSIASLETALVAGGYNVSVSASVSSSVSVEAAVARARAAVDAALRTTVSDKFKGLGLEQAASTVLSESDHTELTAKQIWGILSGSGFTLLSDRPEQSVAWALRKRERKIGDVILVGDGKWGMAAWYSQARLKELRDSRNNASTRNHVEHVEKTKAGIANAKANRGLVQWGRRRSVTGEQMALAYHAIQGGAKSKLQAAKAAKMAWPTFNFYWCEYELENWKPGDAFPPAKRNVPKHASDFQLANMWPRNDRANANEVVVSSTTSH